MLSMPRSRVPRRTSSTTSEWLWLAVVYAGTLRPPDHFARLGVRRGRQLPRCSRCRVRGFPAVPPRLPPSGRGARICGRPATPWAASCVQAQGDRAADQQAGESVIAGPRPHSPAEASRSQGAAPAAKRERTTWTTTNAGVPSLGSGATKVSDTLTPGVSDATHGRSDRCSIRSEEWKQEGAARAGGRAAARRVTRETPVTIA